MRATNIRVFMVDRISLVVDDDPSIRKYISMILQQEHFRSIEAEDGVRGLQIVRELGDGLDLIVSDVQMPKGDGLIFARAVRKSFPAVPIILVSGRGEPAERFDGFVEKPFQASELRQAVSASLHERQIAVTHR